MDTGLHEWEFDEIEKSGSTCLDQCDSTIRGTVAAEKQVALNDAELGAAGSEKQEAVGVVAGAEEPALL